MKSHLAEDTKMPTTNHWSVQTLRFTRLMREVEAIEAGSADAVAQGVTDGGIGRVKVLPKSGIDVEVGV